MSAADTKFGPILYIGDEPHSLDLAVSFWMNGEVWVTRDTRTSSSTLRLTAAEALALAEAITQNVKEPAHA